MSFLVYFFVLLVAASSVLFGLDWMQAPLQPPRYAERTAHAAPPPAPVPVQKLSETKPVAAPPAPVAAASTTVAETPAATDTAGAADTTGTTGDAVKAETDAAAKPAPLCDVSACERAYHTFTPVDCTYKPYEGPRRVCTKGHPPSGRAALLAANDAHAQSSCNVSACENAYNSFDPGTCTYQPYDGPRRLCTK